MATKVGQILFPADFKKFKPKCLSGDSEHLTFFRPKNPLPNIVDFALDNYSISRMPDRSQNLWTIDVACMFHTSFSAR